MKPKKCTGISILLLEMVPSRFYLKTHKGKTSSAAGHVQCAAKHMGSFYLPEEFFMIS